MCIAIRFFPRDMNPMSSSIRLESSNISDYLRLVHVEHFIIRYSNMFYGRAVVSTMMSEIWTRSNNKVSKLRHFQSKQNTYTPETQAFHQKSNIKLHLASKKLDWKRIALNSGTDDVGDGSEWGVRALEMKIYPNSILTATDSTLSSFDKLIILRCESR